MKEISPGYYIFMVILCALFFFCGYKYGDSRGYEDGFQVGYLYDCQADIGHLYSVVMAQDEFLKLTDSVVKIVQNENDSLKKKEYYEKIAERKRELVKNFTADSLKYSAVSKVLSDSLCAAVGAYPTNVVQSNGKMNYFVCRSEKFKALKECQDGFDIKKHLDVMLKKGKKGIKK